MNASPNNTKTSSYEIEIKSKEVKKCVKLKSLLSCCSDTGVKDQIHEDDDFKAEGEPDLLQ